MSKDLGFNKYLEQANINPEVAKTMALAAEMLPKLEAEMEEMNKQLMERLNLPEVEMPAHADTYLEANIDFVLSVARSYLRERGIFIDSICFFGTRCGTIHTNNPDYYVSVSYYPLNNDRIVLTVNLGHTTIQRIEVFPSREEFNYLED